jgi:hypothetical protein
MTEGKIVEGGVIVRLLMRAMDQTGQKHFLVEGFPENIDHIKHWAEIVG